MSRIKPDPNGDRLDALTLKVLLSHKTRNFHAPAEDGKSVCGMGSGTSRRIDSVSPRASPCGSCFSSEVVETWPDQLDGIHAAVRGE